MSADAERALCERYANRIRGYGLRHLRDATRAEDLVQQVLLVLLEAVRAGRAGEPARLDGWVLITCRNLVMDMRRGEQRQQRLAAAAAVATDISHDPSFAARAAIDRQRLGVCLGALDPRDRAIVVATFVEDRAAAEIAHGLQLSAGNVRVIRHRALARLQACLEGRAS
ncbi:MAG TPA: sigma-70 family RNA polymerase sigma factor [Polyangia bacterium]